MTEDLAAFKEDAYQRALKRWWPTVRPEVRTVIHQRLERDFRLWHAWTIDCVQRGNEFAAAIYVRTLVRLARQLNGQTVDPNR